MKHILILCTLIVSLLIALPQPANACGGLFCQTVAVNQQAENIIFTMNGNGTISAIVQISYTGAAPNFSWVVPVPSVPDVDVATMALFEALDGVTTPQFIPPAIPNCAIPMEATATQPALPTNTAVPTPSSVEILAAGTAGPYEYEVVTSPDYRDLVLWLNINNYQITPAMEPLVKVYSDEGMIFLAMKLQPDAGVQDIAPVKMTYESERPMIPLRLTAVAANPNMAVNTWIFADSQAVPVNYAHPVIEERHIRFVFPSGSHNYQQLLNRTADLYEGRAFVTEYAQPTQMLWRDDVALGDELSTLINDHDYVTRLTARISPEEMTVDPRFDFDDSRPDIDNQHDLSDFDAETIWGCTGEPIDIEFDNSVVPENF